MKICMKLFVFLAVFFLAGNCYALTKVHYKTGLTGGTATDLDSIHGDNIDDGNGHIAWVTNGGYLYFYVADVSGGAVEASPDVIVPDNAPGMINWELQTVYSTLEGVTPPSGDRMTGGIIGWQYANNTSDTDHDLNMFSGSGKDSTGVYFFSSTSTMVKRIDAAFVAGTNAGAMLNGSVAANTTYHVYALRKDADATADFGILADGDSIDTYKPAGYTYYRWLGLLRTDSSSNIIGFRMVDDTMLLTQGFVTNSSLTATSMTGITIGEIPGGYTKKVLVGGKSLLLSDTLYMSAGGITDNHFDFVDSITPNYITYYWLYNWRSNLFVWYKTDNGVVDSLYVRGFQFIR